MRLPVWGHSLTPFPSTTLRVNFEIRVSGYINGFWDRVLWGRVGVRVQCPAYATFR